MASKKIQLEIVIEVHPNNPLLCGRCPYLFVDGDSHEHCIFGGPSYSTEGYVRTGMCLTAEAEPGPHDADRPGGYVAYQDGDAYFSDV